MSLSSSVFVTGLGYSTTERQIFAWFSRMGEVESVDLSVDLQGRSKGFCFVNFKRPQDACTSIKMLDNTVFDGRVIRVEFSNRKKRRIMDKKQCLLELMKTKKEKENQDLLEKRDKILNEKLQIVEQKKQEEVKPEIVFEPLKGKEYSSSYDYYSYSEYSYDGSYSYSDSSSDSYSYSYSSPTSSPRKKSSSKHKSARFGKSKAMKLSNKSREKERRHRYSSSEDEDEKIMSKKHSSSKGKDRKEKEHHYFSINGEIRNHSHSSSKGKDKKQKKHH